MVDMNECDDCGEPGTKLCPNCSMDATFAMVELSSTQIHELLVLIERDDCSTTAQIEAKIALENSKNHLTSRRN